MNNPGPLYKPFEKLVRITILDKEVEVPEGNILLRAFQYLAPEEIALGPFCWNEECQHCRITFDNGENTKDRLGLACKMVVQPGMRIKDVAQEIRYRLRQILGKPRKS